MARRSSNGPTEAELEILNVLWQRGPSTVRDVYESLNQLRRTGYTTALKLLQIMTDKGLVRRDVSRRSHIYEPAVERDTVQRKVISSMIGRAFEGSCSKLVLQAIRIGQLTPSELEEIRRTVDERASQTQ
jgi:predicted transcriptional regulator